MASQSDIEASRAWLRDAIARLRYAQWAMADWDDIDRDLVRQIEEVTSLAIVISARTVREGAV